ncbi:MAG: nucleoside deaminase [Clostridia bacterium]|nr:nucleoside deaminase [Clostridia bacterium]
MDRDIEFMREALELARLAADMGEIPVGALVVDSNSGEVIARAHNLRENNKLATAHAEILAIEEACRKRGGWRLHGCTLYVTLEPCPMCAGAIVNSRIDRVVWGADDMVAGCCGSVINFNSYPFNHSFATTSGVCEEECKAVLQEFFQTKRRSE